MGGGLQKDNSEHSGMGYGKWDIDVDVDVQDQLRDTGLQDGQLGSQRRRLHPHNHGFQSKHIQLRSNSKNNYI